MKRSAVSAAGLVAAGLLLALLVVNPLRELLTQDDGWAYARMVERLLKTGEYRLDAWSAANMPVQIYLAAGLAEVFGYSLSLLRCTTLLLLAVGLASLYALLREFGTERRHAALLTLGLLASPLVLMLAFTFMSDAQFLGWMLLALWLYVRGLRIESDALVFCGSLAAACAIGTRQFGIAIMAGLALAWLVSNRQRRPPMRRLLIALAVPLLVGVWQLQAGLREPSFTQVYRVADQRLFLAHSVGALAREGLWRSVTLVHYLGLSLLPLAPLLAGLALRRGVPRAAGARPRRWPVVLATLLVAAGLVWASVAGSPLTARPADPGETNPPPLPLYWMLPTAFAARHRRMTLLLDACGGVVALLFAWVVLQAWWARRPDFRAPRHWPPEVLLLIGAGLSLLVLQLSYVQFNDTYLAGLLPFALLLLVPALQAAPPRGWAAATGACTYAAILVTSLWMRGDYNRQQAYWDGAERLLRSGHAPRDIGGELHWAEYHGAFDEWIAAGAPGLERAGEGSSKAVYGPLHDPFYRWVEFRSWRASYRLQEESQGPPPAGWQLVDTVPYRDGYFAPRSIWILARRAARE